MNKNEIIRRIETFAPPETAEKWDCSGWIVETERQNISKILLALTVTDDVLEQAYSNNCDMIISHHPLFEVPLKCKNIDIYCAHTNLDLAKGGTTDRLVSSLVDAGLEGELTPSVENEFLRFMDVSVSLEDFLRILSKISPNFRYTNPQEIEYITKIGFCAGSGTEFIPDAQLSGADAYVTGDLKFHTALDSKIAVFDIGHFESEIQVLKVFENLIGGEIPVLYARESSPFKFFVL